MADEVTGKYLTDEQWLSLMTLVDSGEHRILFPREPGASAFVQRLVGPDAPYPTLAIDQYGTTKEVEE